MAKKYKAKRKSVQKMTRDGLVEEHLSDAEVSESVREPPDRAAPVRTRSRASDYAEGSFERIRDGERIPVAEELSRQKKSIRKKQLRKHMETEQAKVGRLNFGDEGNQIAASRGGVGGFAGGAAITAAGAQVRRKLYESDDESASADVMNAELAALEESSRMLRYAQDKRGRRGRLIHSEEPAGLQFAAGAGSKEEALKEQALQGMTSEKSRTAVLKNARNVKNQNDRKRMLNRFWQKKRYKDAYKLRKTGQTAGGGVAEAASITESLPAKARRIAKEILRRNSAVISVILVLAMLFGLMAVSLSSCSSAIQGAGTLVGVTTYPSTDEDIRAAENAYRALESALQSQINSTESRHSGYDVYRYQIDEIYHNPYQLISYLTVKYGEFTYDDVKDEIERLFEAQYHMSTDVSTRNSTETVSVGVGESLGNVVTSGYCNCRICCGQWSGGPTASGVMPRANHTIAVDAHTPTVPMGTKIIMNGTEYVVEDTGNFTRYGVDFDVYYDSHSAASVHGHKTWEAFIADDNSSRTVEVQRVIRESIYSVTLRNKGFDAVARANMDEEEIILYEALNNTYGNRDYLFDLSSIPHYTDGDWGYQIPPEALSDEKFARMIHEAEKYLGYPYVWGGSSPSTSFDCSGFVSWVINHCGNGWNYGRLTADGLRGICARVPRGQEKPGDLIFFERTYNTTGASHVGIYVGNGMMIHCGNPIKYTSINTSYWQEHFLGFGRLP